MTPRLSHIPTDGRTGRYRRRMSGDIPEILVDRRPWRERLEEASAHSDALAEQRIGERRTQALRRGLVAGALALAAYAEISRVTPERRDLLQVLDPDELPITRDLARRMTRVALATLHADIQDGTAPRVEIRAQDGPPVLRLRAGHPRYGWMQQEAARCEVTGYVPGEWEEELLAAAARAGEAIMGAGLMRAQSQQRTVWGDLWRGAAAPLVDGAPDSLSDSLFDA